jgi:hypothetical protein
MTVSVLLSCDVPAFVDGQHVGTCGQRSTWPAQTVEKGREMAARAGWRRMAGGRDQCPGHPR